MGYNHKKILLNFFITLVFHFFLRIIDAEISTVASFISYNYQLLIQLHHGRSKDSSRSSTGSLFFSLNKILQF